MSSPYPSESVTENLISQILAVGGTVPPSYGLGELNRALEVALAAFKAGSGSPWPAANGNGPGNLTALTPASDTVGYTLHDRGSGGILLDSTGTGEIRITGGSTASGISINDQSTTGVAVFSNGTVGVVGDGAGGISLSSGGSGGIGIETTGTAAGILLSAGGSGAGVSVSASGPVTISSAEFGVFSASAAQQAGAGITTVAQLVTALHAYGLLS